MVGMKIELSLDWEVVLVLKLGVGGAFAFCCDAE